MRNFIISSILILVFITTIIHKNVYIELSLEVWTFVKDKETLRRAAQQVMEQVGTVIFGKDTVIRQIMTAFAANGHILLEDIPGVGKTTLALAFSKAMELDYHRIQFTPDVLPADLTGFSIYRREEERFVYRPGSVFCNLLLADEINRTSPKTQSALLEVMEERQVTVEGVTRPVPAPFLVIATQNPLGSVGSQPLPEPQVDRFMISMSIGYPDYEGELKMARSIGETNRLDQVEPVMGRQALLDIQNQVCQVQLKDTLYRYLVELVQATRKHPYVQQGGSPRATIALVRLSRASAWLQGRDYVTPRDVEEQLPYVLRHRLILGADARLAEVTPDQVVADVLSSVHRPTLERD